MQTLCTRRVSRRTFAVMLFAGLPLLLSAQVTPSLSVAEAQQQLLRLTVADDMNTDVPPSVRDSIVSLKQALAAETDAIVTTLSAGITGVQVKVRLMKSLPSPSVGKIPDDQWVKQANSNSNQPVAGLYGGELTLSIKQPAPSLLLVQETFDIACGSDNVLLVYSNAGGAWKRVLLWQSKPYISVGEAFGDTYETLLLRPKMNRHPLLLVLHGTPWCASTVSGFDMDVFELGSSDARLIWHGEHGYRRADFDPPLTVRLTPDGFEVRTSVNVWAGEGDRVSRKGVMRYAVTADGLHRDEPLALNARETVEEWLGMPRDEAAAFADEPPASLTWAMFDTFTFRDKPEDADTPLADAGAVRACKDDPAHFQVDVTSTVLAVGIPGGKLGPAYFVQLRQVPNGYRIHTVTSLRDPACSGGDLMAP